MGHLATRRMRNTDPDFYALLGPYLASRKVARELGAPAWDDEGKVWYVALREGAVAGFAAVMHRKDAVQFCSAYVVPDHRGQGVHRRLLNDRLRDYGGDACTVVAGPDVVETYRRAGFAPVSSRGKYTTMRREPHGRNSASGGQAG